MNFKGYFKHFQCLLALPVYYIPLQGIQGESEVIFGADIRGSHHLGREAVDVHFSQDKSFGFWPSILKSGLIQYRKYV